MNKDSTISLIRLISIIMIISCHVLQGIGNEAAYWVNIGVQIFFFTSGYLYGKKEISNYIDFFKSRLKKILLPTFIIVLIMIVVEKLFLHISHHPLHILCNILGLGGFSSTMYSLSHTWFISYILICYLITPILQTLFKNSNNKLITLFWCMATLIIFKYFGIISINEIWIINYILGYFFSNCCTSDKKQKYFFVIISGLAIILLPLTVAVQENMFNFLPTATSYFGSQILALEHVLLGCTLFIVFYEIFSKLNIKYNSILKFSDKYSFFVYLTHQIFILRDFSVLNLTNNLFVNILFIITLSILSGVGLYYIYRLVCHFLENIHKKKIVQNI